MLRRAVLLLIVTLVVTFMVAISGTYNGILTPATRTGSMLGLALVFGGWLLARRGRAWTPTPLDSVVLLGVGVVMTALLANPLAWRRSLMGAWYLALYAGVWYMAADLIALRLLKRAQLVDALLIVGTVVMMVAALQMRQIVSDPALSSLRPVSVFGNANAFGAFLLVLLPLAAARAWMVKGAPRAFFALYTVAALVLLAASFSRGAWVGTLAGGCAALVLGLGRSGRLSSTYWRDWWRAAAPPVRRLVLAVGVLGTGLLLGGLVFFAQTFTLNGRTLDFRTDIYSAALSVFRDRPMTGFGLFTFGAQMPRFWATPPRETHSHAHNLVLHIAAELGIVGLFVLAVFVVVTAVLLWRRGRSAAHEEQALWLGGSAALAGFAVHHLFDVPSMMPAIALVGLLAYLVACAPSEAGKRRAGVRFTFVAAGWLLLLISGMWGSLLYSRYHQVVLTGVLSGDYASAADALEIVIADDPALALTYQQQGMLYALAGQEHRAAAAYAEFTRREPTYATGWANLGALLLDAGDAQAAGAAFEQTVRLAPNVGLFWLQLGLAQDAQGNSDGALAAYRQAVTVDPGIVLHPLWQGQSREQMPIDTTRMAAFEYAVWLLGMGETEAAANIDRLQTNNRGVPDLVLDALIARSLGAIDEADVLVQQSASAAHSDTDRYWLTLWQIANGQSVQRLRFIDAVEAQLQAVSTERDEPYGANVAFIQFLRLGIERQFVPQVEWTTNTHRSLWFLLDALRREAF